MNTQFKNTDNEYIPMYVFYGAYASTNIKDKRVYLLDDDNQKTFLYSKPFELDIIKAHGSFMPRDLENHFLKPNKPGLLFCTNAYVGERNYMSIYSGYMGINHSLDFQQKNPQGTCKETAVILTVRRDAVKNTHLGEPLDINIDNEDKVLFVNNKLPEIMEGWEWSYCNEKGVHRKSVYKYIDKRIINLCRHRNIEVRFASDETINKLCFNSK